MVNFVGRSGELALFSNGSDAAVVNTDLNLVVGVGEHSVLSAVREWQQTDEVISDSVMELAAGAVTTLDIKVITAAGGRAYTIPDSVKAEAQKALEWRKEKKRGGTPVGLNTARTLARGGQIGIEKVRHIAKYFPRHEVDKKGKGWKPGQDGFPSNGRIAWALWGGDAAWRWARAIVERENKKALRAGGYALPGYQDSLETYKTLDSYDSNIDAFKMAHTLDPEYGPEFMARVCLDGSGIDRLYKVDHDGKVCVWDGRGWDDMGHVDGDVWSYDRALDDPYDHVEKDHFIIDPESAVAISAFLQESPFKKVMLEDIDPEEAMLVAQGLPEEDFQMMDYALTAAGDSMSGSKPTGAVKAGDGQYTSAERSTIAKGAPRDATGKFAKTGGRAVVGNNAATGAGTIVGRSKTPGNILFKKDSDGQTIDVPAKYSTPEDQFKAPPAPVEYGKPLDTSGILGEPRTPKSMPGAQLKGTLPPMTQQDMQGLLNDWPSYVQSQREAFKPLSEGDVRQYAKDTNQKIREVPETTRTPISTFKDGKIVQQNIVSKQSSSAKPVKSDNKSVPGRKFGDDNRSSLKPRKFGDDNRSSLKPQPGRGRLMSPLSKPGGGGAGQSALEGIGRFISGRGPVSGQPKYSGKTSAEDYVNDKYGIGKKRGSTVNPSPDRLERLARDRMRNTPDRPERLAREKLRNVKNAERKAASSASDFDSKGRYIVKKGDNLWSIAEKNKPKGQTTAQYWNKVLEANKGRYKSGNPNLIYSGERVILPGVNAPAPKKSTQSPNERLRQVKNAERKADAKAGIGKAPARKFGDERRDNLKPRRFGDDNRSSLKPKPGGRGVGAGQSALEGIGRFISGRGPVGRRPGGGGGGGAAGRPTYSGKTSAEKYVNDKYGIGKAKDNLLPGAPNMSRVTAPGASKYSGKTSAEKYVNDKYGIGKDRVERGGVKQSPDRPERLARERMRQAKNAERAPKVFDDKGRYVVKKGDSLWSIADKYKPAGEGTASYWAKVMKANPKEQFKSGNPSLIYSGERVNLPGQSNRKYGDSNRDNLKPRPKPGQSSNERLRQVKNAERREDSAKKKAASDAQERLRNVKNSERRADSAKKNEADNNQREKLRQVKNAERKADNKPKSTSSAKPNIVPGKTVKPGVPKSLQKPAPSKQPQRNPIRDTLEGLKDRTAYKQETFKPKPKPGPDRVERNTPKPSGIGLNPVKPGVPDSLKKPAPQKQSGGYIVKRGKSGARKRNLPEG